MAMASSATEVEVLREESCGNDKMSNSSSESVKEEDCTERVVSENSEKDLSKTQLKKLMKKQKWMDSLKDRRKQEKEKRKRKMAEAREKGISLGPTRKSLKENSMKNSACKVKVVIDCFFDKYMNDKDINKMVQQLQYCYSINRRAVSPLQFYVCCSNGKTKKRLDDLADYKNWDMYFHESHYWEVFPKEEIVYLTSESPNVLTDLDPSKAYIVGGLVDHNHEKGLCFELAEKRGIYHAKLPIGDFVEMKTRKVLAINHVFEILLRFTETKDWLKALVQVIPQRKTKEIQKKTSQNKEDTGEQVEKQDNTCEQVEKQDKTCEQVEKQDNTCEQVEKQDNTCEQVEKQDNTCEQVEKQDNTCEQVEKQDNTCEQVKKQDNTCEQVEKQDNTCEQVEKQDNTGEQVEKIDYPSNQVEKQDSICKRQEQQNNSCEQVKLTEITFKRQANTLEPVDKEKNLENV